MASETSSAIVATPFGAAALVACSEDAIVGLTPEGIVTSCNRAAERLYKFTSVEMVGQRFDCVMPEEIRIAENRRVERVAKGESVRSADTPRVRQDGTRLVVSSSLFAIRDDNGRIVAVGVIERDVTQQRALEADLLQAKRVETLGRLAGGVAQEFNNIHTAILGLVEFVEPHLDGDSGARDDLENISVQARRGSRLAQHLLAVSDRETYLPGPSSANALLRSMEPLLRRLVGERVWLTLDLGCSDNRVVAGENELELVLFELVMRASDSIGGHGTITITTRHVGVADAAARALSAAPAGGYVEIEVREIRTGAADGSPERVGKPLEAIGTFGMAMVYAVIERFEGHLITRHAPNTTDGARITSVLIPVAPAETNDGVGVSSDWHEPIVASETILLVEDEDAVRDVVSRGLRSRGYHVLEARNGEDALSVAEAHAAPIHIVVSDVVMPQMDGRALFDKLRAWYPSIRFLFISGYTRGAIAAEQLKGPMTEFLAKPFTIDTLATSVRNLLERRRRDP